MSPNDEFDLAKEQKPVTPAEPGRVLIMDKDIEIMKELDQKTYCSGIAKLLYMMKWS